METLNITKTNVFKAHKEADKKGKELLESEKKISSLVQKLIRYIPGINKLIPVNFLMADEFKWLSKCDFQGDNNTYSHGMSIHELVNFKAGQA